MARPSPPMPVRSLWRHARPYLRWYGGGMVALLGTNALALAIPWVLKDAVDAIEGGAAIAAVGRHAAAIALLAVVQGVVRTISRLLILGASRRIQYDVRQEFFAHLQELGATFYDRNRTGDVMSRAVNDLNLLRGLYGPGIMNLLNTAIVYVAATVLMLRLDVSLTLASLAIVPVLLLAVNRLSRRVYHRSREVQERLGEISTRVQENLSGIQQIHTFVQEAREIAEFRTLADGYRGANLGLARIRGWMVAAIGVFSGIGMLIVLVMGGRAVVTGRMSFGDFVAFQAYLAMLTWPTVALGWILNTFQRGVGAMERVDEVLAEVPDIPPPDRASDPERRLRGDIEFRQLTFAYEGPEDGVRRPSLHGVSLSIPAGSRVALVGPVGSGKSTLVNLIARVYPAPPGTLFLDGIDVVDLPVAAVRGSIAYVPQEAFLFSRSIRENIALGDPEASDDDVERAVGLARLARDVERFPEGLGTVVGERGVTLSGGQRQRATLARAAIGDRPILILDDSLSAVDADTERAILNELDGVMEGRTTILVSHRLTTLAGFDRIVVLDDGRVVEDGSHDQLLANDGLYAHLWRRHRLEAELEAR